MFQETRDGGKWEPPNTNQFCPWWKVKSIHTDEENSRAMFCYRNKIAKDCQIFDRSFGNSNTISVRIRRQLTGGYKLTHTTIAENMNFWSALQILIHFEFPIKIRQIQMISLPFHAEFLVLNFYRKKSLKRHHSQRENCWSRAHTHTHKLTGNHFSWYSFFILSFSSNRIELNVPHADSSTTANIQRGNQQEEKQFCLFHELNVFNLYAIN